MFSSLSKAFVVALYDTSEEFLLVFGLLLLAALYGEFLAEPSDKKLSASNKQKRLFEENETSLATAITGSFFKKYKRFLGWLVVLSVFGELLADGGIFAFGRQLQIISDRENSVMALQVAELTSNNLVLKLRLLGVLSVMQRKAIIQQDSKKFINLLKNSIAIPRD